VYSACDFILWQSDPWGRGTPLYGNMLLDNMVFATSVLNRYMILCESVLNRCLKQESVYLVICPKRGPKMEGVVPHRVGILGFFLLNRIRVSDPQWHPYS